MLDEIPCIFFSKVCLKLIGVGWFNWWNRNSHSTCASFPQSMLPGSTAPISVVKSSTLNGSLQVSHATRPSLPKPTNQQHTWGNTLTFLPEPVQLAVLKMLCYIQFPGTKYNRCIPVHLWFSRKTMDKKARLQLFLKWKSNYINT